MAVFTSRVVENPVAETVNVPPAALVLNVSFVITGTAFAMTIVVVGTGVGVRLVPSELAKAAVMVMVPAVVPVSTEIPVEPKLP